MAPHMLVLHSLVPGPLTAGGMRLPDHPPGGYSYELNAKFSSRSLCVELLFFFFHPCPVNAHVNIELYYIMYSVVIW